MTAISSIAAAQQPVVAKLAATVPAANEPLAVTASAPASPTTVVTLGQDSGVTDAQTYTARGVIADPDVPPAWEYTEQDKVSLAMMGNFGNSSSASRFAGLGAALISQLAETGKGISQSVLRSTTGRALEPAEVAAARDRLHTQADNSISLTLKTASGKTVQLTLSSSTNGLSMQADVSGGQLTDDELVALGAMADGFQKAIDGLTQQPPQLKLDALTHFDSKVFSSVDLSTRLKLSDNSIQTFELHANDEQRSLRMSGAAGDMQMSVDLKNSAIRGDSDQQARALKGYINQIEAARRRGDGDPALLSMFEDGFKTLHSNYPDTRVSNKPQTVSSIELTNTDHALLTGLADFSASVSEHSKADNPVRPNELDSFAYDLSQSTQSKGRNQLNRSIEQNQQSHLTASYHKALYPGQKLDLTRDPKSQSYQYFQVEDSASSTTRIGYEKGALVNASVAQSASQSTRVSKYVLGHLEEDTKTPVSASRTHNFLSVLQQALQQDKQAQLGRGTSLLKDALASIQDQVLLQSDPTQLRGGS
ncbi:lactate dehydrogenase [Pseudomonas sp. NPDC090202]|uniref:lactate dehydrogenase n=1 Tax=unclassified Pseudomonas TaxID=196821 RepID=UPI0037F7EF95